MKGEVLMRFKHHTVPGEMPPRFHLPVRRIHYKSATETWFFPIAPFALLFYAVKYSFRIIWMDLVGLLQDTEELFRKKNNL